MGYDGAKEAGLRLTVVGARTKLEPKDFEERYVPSSPDNERDSRAIPVRRVRLDDGVLSGPKSKIDRFDVQAADYFASLEAIAFHEIMWLNARDERST